MSDIETTLAERGEKYGNYTDVARVAQGIKHLLRSGPTYNLKAPHERETLDMIASKLARLVCGQGGYVDSLHDIAGYATLSERRRAPMPASRTAAEAMTMKREEDAKPQAFTLYPGGALPRPAPGETWILQPGSHPPVYHLIQDGLGPTSDQGMEPPPAPRMNRASTAMSAARERTPYGDS